MAGQAVPVVQLMLLVITVMIAVFAPPVVEEEAAEVGALREVLLRTIPFGFLRPPVPEANV